MTAPIQVKTDPERSSDNDHTSSQKHKAIERCKAAGIGFEDLNPEDSASGSLSIFMRCGRETRRISLTSDEAIARLLSTSFEKYTLLSELEAICSYDDGTIKAGVRRLIPSSPPPGFLGRLRGDGERVKPIEIASKPGQPRMELSRCSPEFGVFFKRRGFWMSRITLKIYGTAVKTHDSAVALLKELSSSLFFQLDMSAELPLTLERSARTRPVKTGDNVEITSLEFPKARYDEAPLSLYWYGRSAEGMPLLQYLAFYQAIEFYFPIYSRFEAQRRLKSILKDPTFRSDRDSDIARLLSAVQTSRSGGFSDERSQLKATLIECCDQADLRSFIESDSSRKDYLSGKSKSKYHRIQTTNPSTDIRTEVAERVYDIRCKIVHSKVDANDGTFELLLPFSQEADQLYYDIELVKFLARKVLIASSMSII